MHIQIRRWGSGFGIRFPKEFLREAGLSADDVLSAEIVNGQIVLTPALRHRPLAKRAAEFDGNLNLSPEPEREEPRGTEVW